MASPRQWHVALAQRQVGRVEPLLVIDGTPTLSGSLGAALAGLAPRDIARIDILRDAAATSIYGTRGGSGVVSITTKRAPR